MVMQMELINMLEKQWFSTGNSIVYGWALRPLMKKWSWIAPQQTFIRKKKGSSCLISLPNPHADKGKPENPFEHLLISKKRMRSPNLPRLSKKVGWVVNKNESTLRVCPASRSCSYYGDCSAFFSFLLRFTRQPRYVSKTVAASSKVLFLI